MKYPRRTKILVSLILMAIAALSNCGFAQDSTAFFLKGMDGELLLGQEASSSWGKNWSAPTVSAINLGYMARNGFPLFVPDRNGNGIVDRSDLIRVSEMLGGSRYMNSDPFGGTTDPELLRGLAKYVDETYPGEFEIKVYKDNFRGQYSRVVNEELPEKVFGVPVTVFPDPTFSSYSGELEAGEMVWLGLPQPEKPNNHFLAGRSFNSSKMGGDRYLVDFVDPREEEFRPGWAKIIETVMTESGGLRYIDRFFSVDVMFALSPLDREVGFSECLPDLVCSVQCGMEREKVCVQYSGGDCERVCTQQRCTDPCTSHPGCCGELVCVNWDTICEEKKECERWETQIVNVCRVATKNVGCESANLSTGKFDVEVGSGSWSKYFVNTEIGPGEEQVSIIEVGVPRFENPTCNIDIYDDVVESEEDNNSAEEMQ